MDITKGGYDTSHFTQEEIKAQKKLIHSFMFTR